MSGASSEGRFTYPGLAHELVGEVVEPGAFVVDATAGRGRDTVALARLVGEHGRVLALDLQAEAVRATDALLRDQGLRERVELVHADHARLAELLRGRRPAAVLFNLGFLPGGPRDVVTRSASTRAALEAALDALASEGRVVVVAYRGHPEGRAETAAVLALARGLRGWRTARCHGPHREGARVAPRVVVFERASDDRARGS